MKKLITIFILFLTSISYSQNVTLCLGQDVTVCPNQTVTINDCSNIGGGPTSGNAPYTITNISYTPDPFNIGTSINLSDDAVSSAQNIGFSFCFFGNTYTQFYIGSNGWVSFTGGQPTAYTSATIPSTGGTIPKNCIMGPWQDWHPGTGSNVGNYIKYQVYGVAPFRRLVVSWNSCPMYSCTSNLGTFQIVLFETSNNIETRIQNKPACTSWASGTAVHGLHNLAGNVAVIIPGRNSTQWTTTNESKRFSPGAQWGNTLGQTFPYNNGSLNVSPVPSGTTGYFLKAGCVSGSGTAISDTTWITLANPSVLVSNTSDTCLQNIGSVTAIPGAGSPPPHTYSWAPIGNTQTINNLPIGNYTVTMTDGNGCTSTNSTVINNINLNINTSFQIDSISCYGLNDASIIGQNNLYTYLWSNGITNDTILNLSPGTYTVTYSLGSCQGNYTSVITQPDSIVVQSINDTIICLGQYLTISGVSNIPSFYNWSNNLTTQTINFSPNFSQSICLTVENSCNILDKDSTCFNIIVDELVGSFTFSQNPVNTETTDLELNGYGGTLYTWFSDFNGVSLNNTYTVNLNGIGGDYIFGMIVENSLGCVDTVYNTLTINQIDNIWIPNSFTPDGNEVNQNWLPILSSKYDKNDYNMMIFNKWGNLIWESNDPSIGWDGTYNNKTVQSGVYIWKLKVGIVGNDDVIEINGNVNVLK